MVILRSLILIAIFRDIRPARILTVAPQPSYSHQIIYHPIHEELVRRGHEVTFITTDPAYKDGNAPKNLLEINVGPESYATWKKEFNLKVFGKKHFRTKGTNKIITTVPKIFEMQLSQEKVKAVIEREYDLVILQGWYRAIMLLSHLHKVPVVKMSSMTMLYDNALTVGAPNHPLYHPNSFTQRMYNLTWWEQIDEVYDSLKIESAFFDNEANENAVMRQFYKDMPDLNELNNKVDLLFLNAHALWDNNRPMPTNSIYFGQVHQRKPKPLPAEFQQYMDSSKNGVIYMSFGTVVTPSQLPSHIKTMFLKVFSQLPYDILWKFDEDLPNCPKNVKIAKWFPQSDIFRHVNLKLIITQGGLQTAEEAINNGVPLVCIPFLGDQWLNGENFMHYGVGKMLDIDTITEESFKKAIVTVIEDRRYRARMTRLRSIIHDNPQPPLERVVWWLEHVLKHGGGQHLRSPAANLSSYEYYEIELMAIVISSTLAVISSIVLTVHCLTKMLLRKFSIRFNVKIS